MNDTGALILRGGTLIDVRTGERTPDATVVIEGERITRVGRTDQIVTPAGARIEDTTGAFLIPGLVDMHVHLTFHPLAMQCLPLYLAHGVTTVREVGGQLTVLSLLREDITAGRKVAPRLYFVGPLLDGLPPLWPAQTILVDTVARANTAVRMLAAQGVDGIKVYNNVPEASLLAIVEEAHAAGLIVLGHIPRSLSMTRAIEIGMDCLEHIRITGRELLSADEADRIDPLPLGTRETLLWERFDLHSPGMERLISRLAETRVFLDPTIIIDAATFLGEVEDEHADTLEEALPAALRDGLHRDNWMGALAGPNELKERAREGYEKRIKFIGMCNAAGVRLLAGTDTFGPGAFLPGAGLLNELEFLRGAGLSPLQVLQAATLTAAAALRAENDLGAIEPGKLADIVVLDGDPLTDIRNTRKIRSVVKGGAMTTPSHLIAMVGTPTANHDTV